MFGDVNLAEYIQGIRFPNGEGTETRGGPGKAPLRLRNGRIARSFDLSGKRVLDVGCGIGLYSLYMAESAKEVIGIDHQASRIAVGEETRRRLGFENVQFRVADIRDLKLLEELGTFDLIIAWGFLHRIPDIFTPLYNLSAMTNAFSLEWMTPVFPFMRRASAAYHRNDVDVLDQTNLVPPGHFTADELSSRKLGGRSGYWCPTPYAVESILRKCGFGSARVLGYGEKLWPERVYIVRHVVQRIARRSPDTYARVHMLVERVAGSVTFKTSNFADARFPAWDIAGRTYAGQ